MNILDFFRSAGDPVTEELAADLDTNLEAFPIQPQPAILDRSAAAVARLLSEARADIARLDAEIAELQERRRQDIVIVETFEPVMTKLEGGFSAAADPDEAPAKRKRKLTEITSEAA